jgi:hypothetical protein
VWLANDVGQDLLASPDEIRRIYFYFSPNDSGCVITDVLDFMRTRGITFGGRVCKIDGYVAVDWTSADEVKVALDLFGSLCVGVNLPAEWQQTAQPMGLWRPTNSPIIGGHDITAVGYDETGVQVSTWGMVLTITWAAFISQTWVEECYAMLSPDWYGSDRLAPSGVNADELKADLQKLGGGDLPPLPGPTPPPPPPPGPTPMTYPTYAVSLTGKLPLLGTVTMTGTAVPKPSGNDQFRSQSNAPVGMGPLEWLRLIRQAAEFVRWLQQLLQQPPQAMAGVLPPGVIQLILDNAVKLLPVIVKGLQNGESFVEIVGDCLKALFPAAAAGSPPVIAAAPCVVGV